MSDKTASQTPATAARRTGPRQAEVTRLLPRPLLVVILVALCALVIIPVAYIVFASVNSDVDVARGHFFPSQFTWENYATIWTTVGLGRGIANSLIVAGSTAVVSAVVATATAYALVRFTFLGRVTILRGLLAVQSLPSTLMVLPVFVLFSSASTFLGVTVIGTRWGLFLTYLTFALPFSTWVMVTYLRGLPRGLEEAAQIDGASHLRTLVSIILPLSWPGMIVSAIFAFLLGWNDVLYASVLTNNDTQTAALALQTFGAAQERGLLPLYGQMMAASLISAAPVVVLYLVFQRHLVGGLTTGGVK
ncbi:carbohydrate ABC transporter permease [Streptomyces sp. NPDC046900]|uniref:carbohydrate ABC transporter permease n=1 Tax=Streptomyces sp. NPDC046900 TaxID=3155473 RepID=UPI00340658EF